MRKGVLPGGKISTPVRAMLASELYNAVIFQCDSPKDAEKTRFAALAVRRRGDYDFRTCRRGNDLIVYVDDGRYDPLAITRDLRKETINELGLEDL